MYFYPTSPPETPSRKMSWAKLLVRFGVRLKGYRMLALGVIFSSSVLYTDWQDRGGAFRWLWSLSCFTSTPSSLVTPTPHSSSLAVPPHTPHHLLYPSSFVIPPHTLIIGGSKGVPGTRPPSRVQILSFSCSFRQKICKIIPIWELAHPPRENPWSVTAYHACNKTEAARPNSTKVLLLPPANEVCEGYVFTNVCHSVHRGGSLHPGGGGLHPWGICIPGGLHPAGSATGGICLWRGLHPEEGGCWAESGWIPKAHVIHGILLNLPI